MRNLLLIFLGMVLSIAAGCAMGPDYVRPQSGLDKVDMRVQDNEQLGSSVVAEQVPNDWWTVFKDPLLDSLQERARAGNLDLQKALVRIDQSRANLGIATAALLPDMQADGSYARQALSEHGPMAALGAPTIPQNMWQASGTASWELDLWGRLRRQRERAAALRMSRVFEKELVHVSLSAEVAQTYIQLREAQRNLDISRRHEEIARDSVRLTLTRQQNGVSTSYEVAQARAELARISARVTDCAHQCDVLMNSLALLLAQPPGSLTAELSQHRAIPALPARVPIGLPGELAMRRPDIRKAEEQLHAATAGIGVAEANFFPSITLTGSAGMQSFEFEDLNFWDSRFFSFGPSIHLPIFQGGRLLFELELARKEQVEAALEYRKTVLTAWHEIDNALRLFSAAQKSCASLIISHEQSEQAFHKVWRSYREGEASYLEVLTARRDLLNSESALEAARARESTALVTLYRTVGGGWDDTALISAR